jgi:hypothetical protein
LQILYFTLLGPTVLLSYASLGLSPRYRTSQIELYDDEVGGEWHLDLIHPNTSRIEQAERQKKVKKVYSMLDVYDVERPISPTEFHIIERVRYGCGRSYARSLPIQWERAKEHLGNAGTFQYCC